jgi:hypothetical protein
MTRDWDTMHLDVPKIEESASLSSHRGEHLDEVGAARVKTIQTKGLFNFMELPTEIRVKVCGFNKAERFPVFPIQTQQSEWQ